MELVKDLQNKVRQIVHTIFFELTMHVRKFIIFLVIELFLLFWGNYIVFYYFSYSGLYDSLDRFYTIGISYIYIILIFATASFFSGIVCSEFKNKTGLTIFPLINRYKLFIGKYLANLIYLFGLILVYYLFLILLGYNFYGEPLYNKWILSFGFSLLFILALSSLVTFFSSFMPSSASVIIVICGFFLSFIEGPINNSFMEITSFEPLYSLTYLYQIIPEILNPHFPEGRYMIILDENKEYILWMYPSAEVALIMFSLYTIIFLLLAFIIFKRKELK